QEKGAPHHRELADLRLTPFAFPTKVAPMKILIASDHAGVEMKTYLIKHLPQLEWLDLGPSDTASVDYPDYAQKVAQGVLSGQAEFGILICGSGVGMSMAANRFAGIRAAHVENP